LLALRDHIKATGWKGADDDENAPTPEKIDAYFLQNTLETGSRRPKLVLRRGDNDTLQAMITGTAMPAEPSVRIVEAYELFRELVATMEPGVTYTGVGKLVLVDVSLDRNLDDPQLVFESLNSTGVDLSQSDLIRNFILMKLPEAEQTRLYTQFWSQIESLFRGAEQTFDAFARDYIALKTRTSKQPRADDIYFVFRNAWPGLLKASGSVEAQVAEMLRYATSYAAFALGRAPDSPLHRAMQRLHQLVDVPAMLVMCVHDFYCQKVLSQEQAVDAVRTLESYVLRRAVCRQQTRGYWQVFANLAYALDPAQPLDSLKVGLGRLDGTYKSVGDAEFRRALEHDDIYSLRGVCRFLLDWLENHGSKEPTPLEKLSIEHIMPQSLDSEWRTMLGVQAKEVHEAWLHRLGNLTLTGYNSEYSKRPFAEKKTMAGGFDDSAVRLNKYVRQQEQWTEQQMLERGRSLASAALEIWPELKVPAPLLRAAAERDLRQRAAETAQRVVPMTPKAKALYEALERALAGLGEMIVIRDEASISYHWPEFFMEVLPRRNRLTLIMPLEFSELEAPPDFANDMANWKFIVNAQHSGGVFLSITKEEEVAKAMPIIGKALQKVRSEAENTASA
jgi:predicted transport protein